ncbi:AaceriABR093Cp [[Ashbya] aceris (nom. inval.)]|nr:AaceriABR093Cp [[Ashbya] aceris (nom. inval.)]
MSFNSFPSNQLYGAHRYSSAYNAVAVADSGPGAGRYRKRKTQEAAEDNVFFELGKNKRVTVRQFRNINLVDIREYYQEAGTGEMKPGKKGISLTEEQYDELLQHRGQIDEALRSFGSARRRSPPAEPARAEPVRELEPNKKTRIERREKARKRERTPANPRLDNPRLDNPRLDNPRLDDACPPRPAAHDDDDLNSSDEDFAQALESEVRRRDEDISEEE